MIKKDVITEGRRLLGTGRITHAYAPVLSEALKELEQARACLEYLWQMQLISDRMVTHREWAPKIEALLRKSE